MDCENFAPFFLLYNGGKLNAFGFAAFGNLKDSRVENPPQSAIRVRALFQVINYCYYYDKISLALILNQKSLAYYLNTEVINHV